MATRVPSSPLSGLSRRDLLRASSALAAGLLLAACGGTSAPASAPGNSGSAAAASAKPASTGASAATKPSTLKLSLGLASKPAPALPNSVLWLAKDLGYYDREGLDVSLNELDGTPTVIAAMISGDIDVGNIGTDQMVKLVAQKSVDMRAINSSDARQYFLIASKDSLATVADLKGKNFGVAKSGSLDDTMTRLVLTSKNVKPADLTFAGIGAPDARAAALVAGRIDATTMSLGTWVTIQHQAGVKMLVSADDYYAAAPINLKVNAATAKAIKDKPEQMRRFTAAIMKVSRGFAQDQNAWVDAMTKRRTDLKRADVEELWPAFKTAWAANGLFNLDDYKKTGDYLYTTDDFKDVPKIDVSGWTDTQFVDSVLKEIGVDPKLDPPGRTI
jgi:NitT/TauT family transport system substrate-binding protein